MKKGTIDGTTEAANRVMEVLEQRRLLEALHWGGDGVADDMLAERSRNEKRPS